MNSGQLICNQTSLITAPPRSPVDTCLRGKKQLESTKRAATKPSKGGRGRQHESQPGGPARTSLCLHHSLSLSLSLLYSCFHVQLSVYSSIPIFPHRVRGVASVTNRCPPVSRVRASPQIYSYTGRERLRDNSATLQCTLGRKLLVWTWRIYVHS